MNFVELGALGEVIAALATGWYAWILSCADKIK